MSKISNSNILQLDTTGLLCPLPVLKIQKAIRGIDTGGLLQVLADDPVASIDIPNYCRESGHILLKVETDGVSKFLIQKV